MLARVVRLSLLLVLGLFSLLYKFSVELPVASFSSASETQNPSALSREPLVTNLARQALESNAQASRADSSAEEKTSDRPPNAETEKLFNCSLEDLSACQPNNLVVPGELVNLQPAGSVVVPLTGTIQFIATLINPHHKAWKVIGELLVKKADGSVLILLAPREIRLARGQTLRLPVGLPADPGTFPPGLNEFIAILRDLQGNLIDQASVTFILTLDIPK